MNIRLNPIEARLIGALIEKQITTPDQYPLSLNVLVNACNQKSNRDPQMQLDEATVKSAVEGLGRRHMVLEKSGYGSRVPKYHQVFCNTEFGALKFSPQETAILCELLLRGPQTPGELRARVPRLAELPDPGAIEALLDGLAQRADGPFVVQLAREPGRRESRWAQLFTELREPAPAAVNAEVAPASTAIVGPAMPAHHGLEARVAVLESQIAALRAEVEALKAGADGVTSSPG